MAIFYQIDRISVKDAIKRFEKMTFPSLSQKMKKRGLQDPLFAIIAADNTRISGLLLVEHFVENSTGLIISFFVAPKHRERGIGSKLINLASSKLPKLIGVSVLELVFQSNWKSKGRLMNLLAKNGWQSPVTKMLLCKGSISKYQKAEWIKNVDLPPKISMKKWQELSKAEKIMLQEAETRTDVPIEMRPSQIGQIPLPNLSLILKKDDELIGWWVSLKVSEDTLQRSSFYIYPAHRTPSLALTFSARALAEQAKTNFEYFIFQIDARNTGMMNYFDRYLKEYQEEIAEVYEAILPISTERQT